MPSRFGKIFQTLGRRIIQQQTQNTSQQWRFNTTPIPKVYTSSTFGSSSSLFNTFWPRLSREIKIPARSSVPTSSAPLFSTSIPLFRGSHSTQALFTQPKRRFYSEATRNQVRNARTMYEKEQQEKLVKAKEQAILERKSELSQGFGQDMLLPTSTWASRIYSFPEPPMIPDHLNIRYHILAFWWKWTLRFLILVYAYQMVLDDDQRKDIDYFLENRMRIAREMIDGAFLSFFSILSRFYFHISLHHTYFFYPNEDDAVAIITELATEMDEVNDAFDEEMEVYHDYLQYHRQKNTLAEDVPEPLFLNDALRLDIPLTPVFATVQAKEAGIVGKLITLSSLLFGSGTDIIKLGKLAYGDDWSLYPLNDDPQPPISEADFEERAGYTIHTIDYAPQPEGIKRAIRDVHLADVIQETNKAAKETGALPWYPDVRTLSKDGTHTKPSAALKKISTVDQDWDDGDGPNFVYPSYIHNRDTYFGDGDSDTDDTDEDDQFIMLVDEYGNPRPSPPGYYG